MARQTKQPTQPPGSGRGKGQSKGRRDEKLSGVGGAPASGEPRATGRSRGHLINPDGTPAGRTRPTGDNRRTAKDDPAQAPESGRRDAVE